MLKDKALEIKASFETILKRGQHIKTRSGSELEVKGWTDDGVLIKSKTMGGLKMVSWFTFKDLIVERGIKNIEKDSALTEIEEGQRVVANKEILEMNGINTHRFEDSDYEFELMTWDKAIVALKHKELDEMFTVAWGQFLPILSFSRQQVLEELGDRLINLYMTNDLELEEDEQLVDRISEYIKSGDSMCMKKLEDKLEAAIKDHEKNYNKN